MDVYISEKKEKKKIGSKVSSRKGMFILNFQILLAFIAADIDLIQAFSFI